MALQQPADWGCPRREHQMATGTRRLIIIAELASSPIDRSGACSARPALRQRSLAVKRRPHSQSGHAEVRPRGNLLRRTTAFDRIQIARNSEQATRQNTAGPIRKRPHGYIAGLRREVARGGASCDASHVPLLRRHDHAARIPPNRHRT